MKSLFERKQDSVLSNPFRALLLLTFLATPGQGQQQQGQPTFHTLPAPVIQPRMDGPITEQELEDFKRRAGVLQAQGLDRKTVETNMRRRRCPVDPTAQPQLANPTVPETLIPGASSAPEGAGTLTLFKTHLLTDAETNDNTSWIAEPSIGMNGRVTWVSGNWFSSTSSDYTDNFTYFDPASNFPAAGGGFCCDQVVHFDRRHDLMFYYLQYQVDGTGSNIVRLAVSAGIENQAKNMWFWYDLDPAIFGFADGVWFDFPGLSVGVNDLYLTSNIIGAGSGSRAICIRFDLDVLAVAGSITANNFVTSLPNLRGTQGAGTTQFIGTQVDTNTLRIYRWPEASGSPSSVDRDVTAWAQGSSAPDPGGVDWISSDFNDILAAHTIGSEIFFMWGAAASGGFAFPHIRIARFRTSDSALTGQGQIWSSSTAWAYPDSHPSDYGGLGVGMYFGGGGNYASLVAAVADSFGGSTLGPMDGVLVASGTTSPTTPRWGDYITIRRASPFDNTWIGAGYTMNASAPGQKTEVRTFWFGRSTYQPPATRIIYVDGSVTNVFQDGTFANPYDTVREGFFASWNGDTVVVDGDVYTEAPFDPLDRSVQVLKTGTGDVVIN